MRCSKKGLSPAILARVGKHFAGKLVDQTMKYNIFRTNFLNIRPNLFAVEQFLLERSFNFRNFLRDLQ